MKTDRADDSPALECAHRLVRKVSVPLLAAVGAALLFLWDRSLTLAVIAGAASLWILITGAICRFFRDPEPDVPSAPLVFVSPAHGLVDVIDETHLEFMGGRCRRISIFLSVFDVHVQNAPVEGRIRLVHHQPGRFLNAMKTESARHNENTLIGIESGDCPGERIAVRQIAGLIARRVVTWVKPGLAVARGQRLGLIQFGSRCDLYLPLSAKVAVREGDRVVGGETIVATRAGSE